MVAEMLSASLYVGMQTNIFIKLVGVFSHNKRA
jgi:hypothetical protein